MFRGSVLYSTFVISAFAFPAQAQITTSAGLEFVTGNYGKGQATGEWKVTPAASYRAGRWLIRVSLPISRVEGISNLTEQDARDHTDEDSVGDDDDDEGGGGGGAGAVTFVKRSQTGVGDSHFSAGYLVLEPNEAPAGVEVMSRIKIPVASDERCYLTNGEVDYSLQVNAFQSFGQWDPFVTAGWTKRGDPVRRDSQCNVVSGRRVDLRDPFYFGFGAGFRLTEVVTLRAEYEFRDKLRATSDPRSEAKFSLARRLDDNLRLNLYGILGFSDNSPDWGLGATVSYRY